jgi:hypothetical protein
MVSALESQEGKWQRKCIEALQGGATFQPVYLAAISELHGLLTWNVAW